MFNFNKKFWVTSFTLTGTMIGAGILALPYVFSQSGFLIGLFWLLFLGVILIYVKLCLGEVTLRTKGIHQLPGYAKIYLGITGKRIIFFAMIFGIYSALLAYLMGSGQSFSKLFSGTLQYSIIFGILIWVFITLLLKEGLKGLKEIEFYGVIITFAIIIGIFLWFLPNLNYDNTFYINKDNFFLPFGVTLFALLGFSCIPELRREIRGSENLLRKAIITGALVSIISYILFSLSFVGTFGENVGEVATLSSGNIVIILGIFTMLTSYFVLSFVLRDIFIFDLKKSKLTSFIFVSLVPLLLYIIISIFNLAGFVFILGIGGVISGGLTGIIILLINIKSKEKSQLKPAYSMPLNWPIIIILSLIFILGVVIEIFF